MPSAANTPPSGPHEPPVAQSGPESASCQSTISSPSPLTFANEGVVLHQTVTVTDAAGNSASFDSVALNIDKTAPLVAPVVAGPLGINGWYVGDTQLAFWVRNPNGGIVKALEYNPKITVLYRDTPNRVNMLFQGTGRVETDEAIRNRVFETMPQIEQDHDEPRKGACMVVDLHSVNGATFNGPVRMANPKA